MVDLGLEERVGGEERVYGPEDGDLPLSETAGVEKVEGELGLAVDARTEGTD